MAPFIVRRDHSGDKIPVIFVEVGIEVIGECGRLERLPFSVDEDVPEIFFDILEGIIDVA